MLSDSRAKGEKNHIYSYQFKVEGIKKSEYVGWDIESDSKVSSFKVEHGRVYMWKNPSYEQKCEEARVVATLENGSRVTAKLYGCSERNIAVEEVVNDFVSRNLTADMTEYEKLEAIAAYVSHDYEYQLYQPDWLLMVLSGSGDCFSSRRFVTYLCRAAGINAVPCVGDNLDGMTLAKADGKLYVVLTGFKDNQPRKYRVYEPPADALLDNYRELRDQLIDDGVIKQGVFKEDYTFSSISAAASVVSGRTANGWTEWMNDQGITYQEMKHKN